MTETARNIVVGLTALTGLAGMLVLLLLFGYAPDWLEGGYQVRIYFDNASGLLEGSRVRLSGIDVGRVTHVQLRGDAHHGVEVVTRVHDDVRIPAAARVHVQSPLLGGNPTLAFQLNDLSPQQMRQYMPHDGSAIVQGEAITLASQFTGQLRAAIEEPTRRFTEISRNFTQLSAQWQQVGQNLNQLLEAKSIQDVDAGQTKGNLATVLARADQRLSEMHATIQGLNRWVNDDQVHADAADTVAQARLLMVTLNESVGRLERRYAALADDLSGIVGSVRIIADKAASGQGTIGKLLHDPAVYDNLNDAVERLQTALDEMRLMFQKWKAEGLPVQF